MTHVFEHKWLMTSRCDEFGRSKARSDSSVRRGTAMPREKNPLQVGIWGSSPRSSDPPLVLWKREGRNLRRSDRRSRQCGFLLQMCSITACTYTRCKKIEDTSIKWDVPCAGDEKSASSMGSIDSPPSNSHLFKFGNQGGNN